MTEVDTSAVLNEVARKATEHAKKTAAACSKAKVAAAPLLKIRRWNSQQTVAAEDVKVTSWEDKMDAASAVDIKTPASLNFDWSTGYGISTESEIKQDSQQSASNTYKQVWKNE